MNNDTFTAQQIETLRSGYSKIGRVDPCGESYPKLCELLDKISDKQLIQIEAANIKFVSKLARNRMVRRGLI